MAYVLRFLHNAQPAQAATRRSGPLSSSELNDSFLTCVRLIQATAYAPEIATLRSNQPISPRSSILSLRPFLDSAGLLRVGGRLRNSRLPYDAKHQLLLPKRHHFVKAYVKHVHLRLLHATSQMVLAEVRQRLWVPALRQVIKQVASHCVTCFKDQPRSVNQLMGQLPDIRVQPSTAFLNVGVDYAGPFAVRYGGPRAKTTHKVYLAVFICMATTAIHVELVSSLSAKAFLDAFARFTARRGLPSIVYSDNATNFVGAQRELAELSQLLSTPDFQESVKTATARHGVTWKFIPPRSPHFGGLWESAIKSFKRQLRRASSSQIYTFEELLTLTASIEAILNSRPLCRLTDDPEDFHYLSPSHFLLGRSLTMLPHPNLQDISLNRLDRYQRLQRTISTVWTLWSTDYLQSLQRLSKWKSHAPDLKVGAVVLLIDDNPLLSSWTLGVVHEVHPGPDGLIRVATVRTSHGLFKRPLGKIAPLPFE